MLNWLVAKARKCSFHLRPRDAGVDENLAIGSCKHGNIAAGSLKDANVTAQFGNVDLRGRGSVPNNGDGTGYLCLRIHDYDWMKASSSALMTSACVVIMPCGKSLYVLSVPFLRSLAESGPAA